MRKTSANINKGLMLYCPDNIREIGESEFQALFNFNYISINEGCSKICSKAFAFCFDLETVIIPSSMKYIESDAFHRCINLKYFIVLNPDLDISNIQLPDGCKIIRG